MKNPLAAAILHFILVFATFNPCLAKPGLDWFDQLSPELQAYYAPAKGVIGAELFEKLHLIVAQNQKVTEYRIAKDLLYTEVDPIRQGSQSGLIDVYSMTFVPGTGSDGSSYIEIDDQNGDGRSKDFINCEHTWPQTYFKQNPPMVSDLHHMFPVLSLPNERRSSFPFGMANEKPMVIYSTAGHSKLAVEDSLDRSLEELKELIRLPYPKRPNLEKELDAVFEPGNDQKGNTARAMLYFYLRYHNEAIKLGTYDHEKFWASKVGTLIQWSEVIDPVERVEGLRNDRVFRIQGNRNPFVDIKDLGSLIGRGVLQSK